VTVKVKFFAYFREAFGARDLALPLPSGANVGAALDRLCDTPARRSEIFEGPALKPHIVIMINGAGLPPASGLATALADGDVLAIFPMMGGG
jgi:molybdopterin synthase sulfur carrier subunit